MPFGAFAKNARAPSIVLIVIDGMIGSMMRDESRAVRGSSPGDCVGWSGVLVPALYMLGYIHRTVLPNYARFGFRGLDYVGFSLVNPACFVEYCVTGLVGRTGTPHGRSDGPLQGKPLHIHDQSTIYLPKLFKTCSKVNSEQFIHHFVGTTTLAFPLRVTCRPAEYPTKCLVQPVLDFKVLSIDDGKCFAVDSTLRRKI